jgi:uncharacterized protein
MGKFVFWVGVLALIWLAFRLVKILQRKHRMDSEQDRSEQSPAHPGPKEAVPVMQCARCGVYVPDSEAVFDHRRVFCSIEHRDAGPTVPHDRSET